MSYNFHQINPEIEKEYNKVLADIPSTSPLVLLPVRLETSFCKRTLQNGTKQKQLRVRIVPDEIMLDYFKNAKLTRAEVDDGKFFWLQWYIASGCEKREYEAWENLCSKYPLYKAAWICKSLKPSNITEFYKDGENYYRRPYVNSLGLESAGSEQRSGIESIEEKCQNIYTLLSQLNFDEKEYRNSSAKEIPFEKKIRTTISSVNSAIFSIESQLSPCKWIVDYLYDNVHETMLYVQRRLDSLNSIYTKYSNLKQPRSFELWDIDYSVLESLIEKVQNFLVSLENRRITLVEMINQYRKNGKVTFPYIEVASDNEVNVPVCTCLPDKFLLIAEPVGQKIIQAVSAPIDIKNIQMGLNPNKDQNQFSVNEVSGDLQVDPKLKWLTDYDTAERCGMAITVNVDEKIKAFQYISVVGVQSNKKDRTSLLNSLFFGHNYINSNMRLVKAGTPTNLIDKDYESDEEYLKKSRYEIEVTNRTDKSAQKKDILDIIHKDAAKLACLFKSGARSDCYTDDYQNVWSHIVGYDSLQDYYTRIAYEKLWNFCEGLNHNKAYSNFLKKFFLDNVRARGNLATIQIDKLPYGILPTTDFIKMSELLAKETFKNDSNEYYARELLNGLIDLANCFQKTRNRNTKWSEKFVGKEAQKNYLEMAGQLPYSVSYTERTLVKSPFIPSPITKDDASKTYVANLRILRFLSDSILNSAAIIGTRKEMDINNSDISKMRETVATALRNAGMKENVEREAALYTSEFIDLLTYRLDAWFAGIINFWYYNKIKTVDSPYVGAFGWAFNLQESDRNSLEATGSAKQKIVDNMKLGKLQNNEAIFNDSGDGHFILAPSIQHARTAAVLRSSFLKAKGKSTDLQICVNLSSARARQALRLVEGVKSGMSLGIILGADFERSLHDAKAIFNVEMDRYIYPLRQLFPQVVDINAQDERANNYVMQVINGEALLNTLIKEWNWSKPISTWLAEKWNIANYEPLTKLHLLDNADKMSGDQRTTLFKLIEQLMDSYDALNDLLLSEGVHRLIMGDKSSYYAISSFLATGEGNLPDPEILDIPSEHVVISHKAGILLPQTIDTPDKVMCIAEPALNSWIESQLGGMENILFFVKSVDTNGNEKVKPHSLAELNITGIEYMYLSGFEKTFLPYVETRFRKKTNCYTDKLTILESAIDANFVCDENQISLEENKLRIEAIRGLVARSRAMCTNDWFNHLCDDKAESELIDLEDLKHRFELSISNLEYVKSEIEGWLQKTSKNAVFEDAIAMKGFSLLCDCYESGMMNSINEYDTGAFIGNMTQTANPLEYDNVATAQENLRSSIKQAQELLQTRIDDAKEMLKTNSTAEGYTAAIQAITLSNFKVNYLFKLDSIAISTSSLASIMNHGVNYYTNLNENSFSDWQDEVSEVRDGMKLMQKLSMTQLALDHDLDKVAILQSSVNPESGNATNAEITYQKWLGVAVSSEADLRDADSLTIYNSSAYNAKSKSFSGFVFDSWIEYIPYKKHDAGLALHKDWPDNEAPQAILVAWNPKLPTLHNRLDGPWDFKSLQDILPTTRFMMMNRALEPEYIYKDKKLSKILPLTSKRFDTANNK